MKPCISAQYHGVTTVNMICFLIHYVHFSQIISFIVDRTRFTRDKSATYINAGINHFNVNEVS